MLIATKEVSRNNLKRSARSKKREKLGVYGCLILSIVYAALSLVFVKESMTAQHFKYNLPFVGYGGTFNQTCVNVKYAYVATFLVGVISMYINLYLRSGKYKITKTMSLVLTIGFTLVSFLGAKLLFILENIQAISNNGISLGLGGVSFYGAVFFVPLLFWALHFGFKYDTGELLDYLTTAGLIMLTCIRTGCFLKGCCAGIQLWRDSNSIILPVQLWECSLNLILLAVVMLIEQKGMLRGRR